MRVVGVCLMVLAISGCESPDEKARKLVARMVATPSDWNRKEHKRTVSEAKDELLQLGQAALPAIIDGLGDDNRSVGMWLMEPIVAAGDSAVIPLAGALLDGDADRRRWALLAITGVASKGIDISAATPAILKCTGDADPETRANSLLAISCAQDNRGVPQLISALNDSDEHVHLRAVKLLGVIATVRVPGAVLQEDPFPRISPSARSEIRPLLIAALSDESASVRRGAAESLGEYGPSVEAALESAMKDSDAFVRAAALRSLACIRTDGAVTALINGLADPSARVRVTAAEWLGMLADPDTLLLSRRCPPPLPKLEPLAFAAAIPALTTASDDDDPGVRSAATKALEIIRLQP